MEKPASQKEAGFGVFCLKFTGEEGAENDKTCLAETLFTLGDYISDNSRTEEMMAKVRLIGLMAMTLIVCGLAVAATQADPVGTWKCEYNIGDQKRTSTLTIKKDGDKLTGTMSWPDQKEAPLKDVKSKDGELMFSAVREVGGNSFQVEYKFTVSGDALKGKGTLDAGGEKRDFDIEGKREKKGD